MFSRVGDLIRSVTDAAGGTQQPAVRGGRRGRSESFDDGRGVGTMDMAMQARFKHGVKYNMKIVIRGARGTGKSSLLRRLQGCRQFDSSYQKSPQIQAATVLWSSRPSTPKGSASREEVIKLEVWDVVDEGFQTPEMERRARGIKGAPPQVADASSVDVYRGAHGVIFMVDSTKPETLDYVRRELPSVPREVLVLVCRNFTDMTSAVVVRAADVEAVLKDRRRTTTNFMAEAARGARVADVYSVPPRQIATSMVNCFGLRELYNYFNLPFKFAQINTLESQLRALWTDVASLDDEFCGTAEDLRYDEYVVWLEGRSKIRERPQPEPAKVEPARSPDVLKTAYSDAERAGYDDIGTGGADAEQSQPPPPTQQESRPAADGLTGAIDDDFFVDHAGDEEEQASDGGSEEDLTAAELALRAERRKERPAADGAAKPPAKIAPPAAKAAPQPAAGGADAAEGDAESAADSGAEPAAEPTEPDGVVSPESRRHSKERQREQADLQAESTAAARQRAAAMESELARRKEAEKAEEIREEQLAEEQRRREQELSAGIDTGNVDESFFDDDGDGGDSAGEGDGTAAAADDDSPRNAATEGSGGGVEAAGSPGLKAAGSPQRTAGADDTLGLGLTPAQAPEPEPTAEEPAPPPASSGAALDALAEAMRQMQQDAPPAASGGEQQRRRRRDEGAEGERDRRRRRDGDGAGEKERRRRRDEAEVAARDTGDGDGAGEKERRRRRDEAGDGEQRDRQHEVNPSRVRDRERERGARRRREEGEAGRRRRRDVRDEEGGQGQDDGPAPEAAGGD